jgi:hypothetical protein
MTKSLAFFAALAMTPPRAGVESEALKPFARSMVWSGKVPAGAWGPASPEMSTRGRSTCKWIIDGLWASCDLEDSASGGDQSMSWRAHWTFGWDFGAKAYRAMIADSWGVSSLMNGKLDGSKLTWESAGEVMALGQPTRFRFSLDAGDPKAIKFMSEHTANGKWLVDEEAVMKPAGGR